MIIRLFLASIICFLSFSGSPLWAGAWTQKQGAFFYKLGLLRFESSSQYLLNGDREPLSNNGTVVDLTIYNYLEYGLFDDLTLIATVPFKRISFDCAIEDCGKSSSGLADLSLGFRYRLTERPWIISLESRIKLAPGYETDEDKLDSAPPLGDGQTDFDIRLLLGSSLFNFNGYLNIDAGYRGRAEEPADEFPFSLEMGYNLTDHYTLIGRLHGVRSIAEGSGQENFRIIDGKIENFIGTGTVEDFLKAQLQLFYRLNSRFGLSFEFDQVLLGRNTAHASTFGIGLVFSN